LGVNAGKIPLSWKPFRAAADAVASVLFPAPCRTCRQPLETSSRIPICPTCLDSLQRIESPLCRRCGRPFPSVFDAEALRLCRACVRGLYGFDLARSFARYDPTMQRLVTLLKYSPAAPLGSWLAGQLDPIIRAETAFEKVTHVVPVPLDRKRLRERGYNQAELIARPLAKRLGLPIATDLLIRLRSRPARLKLSRRERWETVRGAFQARQNGGVDKSHILLVDDVLTSGATLDACARALRSAGAEAIYAVTVARVMPQGEPDAPGATR
jgi:competence protein ComFC